jgi:Glyoxalase-like domain
MLTGPTTCVVDGRAALTGSAPRTILRCIWIVRTISTVFVMATHWTLGCDANDPHRLADFWAQALGYIREPGYDDPDGASIIDPEGKAPAIGWLRVPEGKSAKNRLHIDIRVAGEGPWDMARRERLIQAKVPELVARGATVMRGYDEGVLDHVVMLDPEGNEFCVA